MFQQDMKNMRKRLQEYTPKPNQIIRTDQSRGKKKEIYPDLTASIKRKSETFNFAF